MTLIYTNALQDLDIKMSSETIHLLLLYLGQSAPDTERYTRRIFLTNIAASNKLTNDEIRRSGIRRAPWNVPCCPDTWCIMHPLGLFFSVWVSGLDVPAGNWARLTCLQRLTFLRLASRGASILSCSRLQSQPRIVKITRLAYKCPTSAVCLYRVNYAVF